MARYRGSSGGGSRASGTKSTSRSRAQSTPTRVRGSKSKPPSSRAPARRAKKNRDSGVGVGYSDPQPVQQAKPAQSRSPVSAPRKDKGGGRSGYTDNQPIGGGKALSTKSDRDNALSALTSMLANGTPQESAATMYKGTMPRQPSTKNITIARSSGPVGGPPSQHEAPIIPSIPIVKNTTFGGLMGPTGGSPQYGAAVVPARPTMKDVTFGGLMGPSGGPPQYGQQVGSGLFEALTGMPGADEQGVAYGPDNLRPGAWKPPVPDLGGIAEAISGLFGRGKTPTPGLPDNYGAPDFAGPVGGPFYRTPYVDGKIAYEESIGRKPPDFGGGLTLTPAVGGPPTGSELIVRQVPTVSVNPDGSIPSAVPPTEPSTGVVDKAYTDRLPRGEANVDLPGDIPLGSISTGSQVVTLPDGRRVNVSTSTLGNPAEGSVIPTESGLSVEEALLSQVGAVAPSTVLPTSSTPSEPSLWDNTVDTLGNIAGATGIGRLLNLVNPEIGGGISDWLKNLDNAGAASNGTRDPRLDHRNDGVNDRGNDISADYYPGIGYTDPLDTIVAGDGGTTDTTGDGGTTDTTGGGGTTDTTGGGGTTGTTGDGVPPVYDRWGNVVFPDIPPYNPGRDAEWLYFRKNNFADGGIVGPQARGNYAPTNMAQMDPRIMLIADAEDAIVGKSPNPDRALSEFVKSFGEVALGQLKRQAMAGRTMRSGEGRLVDGPGGPKDDMVPARIEGKTEARLSDGEFIMSADAVTNAGDGNHKLGAKRMTQLNEQLMGRDGKAPVRVEKVR